MQVCVPSFVKIDIPKEEKKEKENIVPWDENNFRWFQVSTTLLMFLLVFVPSEIGISDTSHTQLVRLSTLHMRQEAYITWEEMDEIVEKNFPISLIQLQCKTIY